MGSGGGGGCSLLSLLNLSGTATGLVLFTHKVDTLNYCITRFADGDLKIFFLTNWLLELSIKTLILCLIWVKSYPFNISSGIF